MSAPAHGPIAARALRDTAPAVFWTDRADAPPPAAAYAGQGSADLVVVGGGLTGLWAAIEAKRREPARDVVVLESGRLASGASGRNGGFLAESLTHGLAHGVRTWPDELPTLLRMGRENLREIRDLLAAEDVDAQLHVAGKSVVAVKESQLVHLEAALALNLAYGEDASLLDGGQARADVASPSYVGALRVRTGNATVNPALLTWGLARVAERLGVRIHEDSPVTGLDRAGPAVLVRVPHGALRTGRVVLATSAFPPLLRRLRGRVIPVLDHVLVTEPLSTMQWDQLGWRDRQGMTDLGNRFHYYRATHDGRILFGGYDATYHFGGAAPEDSPSRVPVVPDARGSLLRDVPPARGPLLQPSLVRRHRHDVEVHPDVRYGPRRTRRRTPSNFMGLGVGASRFGARVALDLVDGRRTERTALRMVTTRPVPFPPEPVRYPLIRVTPVALARTGPGAGARTCNCSTASAWASTAERPDRPTPYPRGPPMTDGLHIDGARRSGAGPVRVLVDPSTGEPMDEVTEATPAPTGGGCRIIAGGVPRLGRPYGRGAGSRAAAARGSRRGPRRRADRARGTPVGKAVDDVPRR